MAEATINDNNPTKFYTHFLYKAIFISFFLLLLPLSPSQPHEFINNKTITTTCWEFLQLVFVGIAVSYGLLSKRNDETHKEEGPFKSDNNDQSYVARRLQVSSVFDDDSENKVQTWKAQYYRGEPIVVVAKESDEATTIEKPLFSPVGSFKNSVSESSMTDSIVLRSPIPWRSRSGRVEAKEDLSQTSYVHDTSEMNPTDSSFRYQSKSLKHVLNPSCQEKFHPSSPTLSSEIRLKSLEYVSRRNIIQKSSRSDTLEATKSFRTRKEAEMDEYLSHDKEIGRFVERRGSQIKRFMDDETQTFAGYSKEKLIETGQNSDESEDEEEEEDEEEVGLIENVETVASDSGPDVDKKADEFIAKFREQIKLQRTLSLRR
ncbi:hypothetical protein Hdeb2414_s0032g00710351 [Helianthus debilis subsp. tardiflorus]